MRAVFSIIIFLTTILVILACNPITSVPEKTINNTKSSYPLPSIEAKSDSVKPTPSATPNAPIPKVSSLPTPSPLMPVDASTSEDLDRSVKFIGVVKGLLLYKDTMKPVPNKPVIINQQASISKSFSNENGYFRIDLIGTNRDLEIGSTYIKKVPFKLTNHSPEIEINLLVDCDYADERLLDSYGSMSTHGKILNSNGNIVENVRVRIDFEPTYIPEAYPCKFNRDLTIKETESVKGTYAFNNVPKTIPLNYSVIDRMGRKIFQKTGVYPYRDLFNKVDIHIPLPTPHPYEITTFNGKVYDGKFLPVDKVKITAKSLDPTISFEKNQYTFGGTYSFNEVPVGIKIEVTAEKEGYLTRRIIIRSTSNTQRTPNDAKHDFGTDGTANSTGSEENALVKIEKSPIPSPTPSPSPTSST